jgi:hypothetical protein
LQALAVAGLAVSEGVGADEIQGIPIRQLGGAQRTELVRRGQQFQFGEEAWSSLPRFYQHAKRIFKRTWRRFLPMVEARGFRARPC